MTPTPNLWLPKGQELSEGQLPSSDWAEEARAGFLPQTGDVLKVGAASPLLPSPPPDWTSLTQAM